MSEPNIMSKSSTSSNYFHISDIPGFLISPVLLREDNYEEWSTNIRKLLQEKQKIGFIDGSIPKPLTNPELTMWLGTNSIIVSWILVAIDPKIRSTVTFITDAYKLWESLRRRFSVGNGVRVHELKAKIYACKQEEGQSVQDYFGRLSKLWEELKSYKSTRVCSCDAAKDEQVHQFLMGLDESRFSSIRFIIVGQEPLQDLNQVYSLVIKEEQRFQAARSKELNPVTEQQHVRPRDKHVSCSHCGRKGHEVEKCFLIHGYPESWHEQQRNKSSNTRRRRGSRAASAGKSTNARERVDNASQTTVTKSSVLNIDEFSEFLKLRNMQHPESIIYYAASSGATNLVDSNRFSVTQKLEAKGRTGGKEWDDGCNHEDISAIYIREGCEGIESIKFDYVKNGQPKAGPIHGGFGYSKFTEWLDLTDSYDEHILSVKCYFDEGAIQGFVIKTNIKTSALMGYNLGTTFKLEVQGKKIIGFHGSSDKNLRSIGGYFAPIYPANLKY